MKSEDWQAPKVPDGFRVISIYETDAFLYRLDPNPEVWQAQQRLVPEIQYAELIVLHEAYRRLQRLLAEIHTLPEYDAITGRVVTE